MGRIYKNGINYSGGVVPASASVVHYDNTTSGLTSTNSQSAIDELARPTFTEATTLANVNSGESTSTLWGKVKKMFNSVGRTTLLQSDAFDIGASLTVIRFNSQVYNINGSKYVDFDILLSTTNTIAVGATLLTFKSGYRPINDITITGIRTGAIVTQTNIRTTGVVEYGGANTASITSGQAIYLNGRYSI